MIGTFPPPVHGMAAATKAVFDRLITEGWQVEKFNTAPSSLSRRVLVRLGRLPAILRTWRRLVTAKWREMETLPVVYVALAGGWGQVYDLVTVAICRVRGLRCVLHHHNYSYLDKYHVLTSLVFRLANNNRTVHVALCKSMGQRLDTLYDVRQIVVLSNSVLFSLDSVLPERRILRVVGFLSNVTHQKGGGSVISLARAIRKRGWPMRVIVAGPCHDKDLAEALKTARGEGILEWLGPVYGESKRRFWEMVDVFVFPTEYKAEAEPLVVWEALAASVPVIAYGRGCITSQLEGSGSISMSTDMDFVEVAVEALDEWQDPDRFHEASEQARHHYESVCATSGTAWANFIRLMQGDEGHAR